MLWEYMSKWVDWAYSAKPLETEDLLRIRVFNDKNHYMRSCLVPTCVGVVGILLDMIQNRLCRVLTLGDQDSGQGEGIPSFSFFPGVVKFSSPKWFSDKQFGYIC